MNKSKLITSGKLSEEFKKLIDNEFSEIICLHARNNEEVRELLPQADYAAGFNFLIGHDISHLKWIHSFGAGVDSFMRLSVPENCILSKTTGKMGQRMAEYCLAYILEDLKQLPAVHQNQQHKIWNTPLQNNLFRKDIVILGTGYVGSEIAKILGPLANSLTGINTSGKPTAAFAKTISIHEFSTADFAAGTFFINTLPLTAKTKGLLNENFFRNLTECVLINIGRGAILDDKALMIALSKNQLRKAILDVFNEEPLPKSSPFWEHPQCIVTPHMSGPTSLEDIKESFSMAYKAVKNGEKSTLFIEKEREY